MQIQSINNYSKNNVQTNFKSAYPVVYWVKNTSKEIGTESPTISKKLTERLQGKLVRYLNGTGSKSNPKNVELMKRAFAFIKKHDRDYSQYPFVRSFCCSKADSQKEGLKPIGYLLTGKDTDIFENNFGKPIGRTKAISPIIGGKARSAELDIALDDYYVNGLNYIKKRAAQFCNNNIAYELHVNFEPTLNKKGEIIRNKDGSIKDYMLSNMTFRPTSERNINPFEGIKK